MLLEERSRRGTDDGRGSEGMISSYEGLASKTLAGVAIH